MYRTVFWTLGEGEGESGMILENGIETCIISYMKRITKPSFLKKKSTFSLTFGEGNGNPFQYSCLEIPIVRGAWWSTVHGIVKSRT